MEVGGPLGVNGYAVSFASVTGEDGDGTTHRVFTIEAVLPGPLDISEPFTVTIGLVRTIADAKELRDALDLYIAALDDAMNIEIEQMLNDDPLP